MADGPQLVLPRQATGRWTSLIRRSGLAVAIVLAIALLAFIGRSG
jgi:hypothetical protein